MFRIIVWFLIFYFLYRLFKKLKSPNIKKNEVEIKTKSKEKMIKCEYCNLYSPESSIITKNGKHFCSKKCMEEYFRNENK